MDNMFRDLRAFQKQKEIAVNALVLLYETAAFSKYEHDIIDKALKEIKKIEQKM